MRADGTGRGVEQVFAPDVTKVTPTFRLLQCAATSPQLRSLSVDFTICFKPLTHRFREVLGSICQQENPEGLRRKFAPWQRVQSRNLMRQFKAGKTNAGLHSCCSCFSWIRSSPTFKELFSWFMRVSRQRKARFVLVACGPSGQNEVSLRTSELKRLFINQKHQTFRQIPVRNMHFITLFWSVSCSLS